MITVTAYNWVPDFAKGLVRDLRVRWALEEAGLAYQVKLITQEEKLTPSYRALQPFSQVPAYQDDDVALFESGAIVLHIGRKRGVASNRSSRSSPSDGLGVRRAEFRRAVHHGPHRCRYFQPGGALGESKAGLTGKRWSRSAFLIWRNV